MRQLCCIVFYSILLVVITSAQQCWEGDLCDYQKTGDFRNTCENIQRSNINEVPASSAYLSDMITSDNGRLGTAIVNARKWVTSMARSPKGNNDTVGIPDGGDTTKLRIDLNNWCCLTAEEGDVIAGILTNLKWKRITVKMNKPGCVKVWQPDADPTPPTVVLGAFADDPSNAALTSLIKRIENQVMAFRQSPVIPVVNPRVTPVFIPIATVHTGVFPVQDALDYLVASSTTDAMDQQFGTGIVQAISFRGNLYYAEDAYIAPVVQDCPDCNTSTGTMIAAVLIFIFGMGIFYGCYYYREKIKSGVSKVGHGVTDMGHRAQEMARKALKPHGQTDSADA